MWSKLPVLSTTQQFPFSILSARGATRPPTVLADLPFQSFNPPFVKGFIFHWKQFETRPNVWPGMSLDQYRGILARPRGGRSDTSPHGPVRAGHPRIQTWTVAKADQKEMEGHSPSLDWYARTPLSAFGWRRKLALRCISHFLTEIAERWVREPILPGRSGRVRKRRAADGKLSEVS
jgi:hypothetical protein